MPGLDFIKNIIAGKGADLLNSVKGIIDESKFSAEEKAEFEAKMAGIVNEHTEKMATLAQSEFETAMKDVQSARDANARIQETSNASWMAKNIAYCLDLFIVAVWGFLTIYLVCIMLNLVQKQAGVDYTAVTAVWGGVTAFAGTVINFHRGTSAGSKSSGDTLRSIVQQKLQ